MLAGGAFHQTCSLKSVRACACEHACVRALLPAPCVRLPPTSPCLSGHPANNHALPTFKKLPRSNASHLRSHVAAPTALPPHLRRRKDPVAHGLICARLPDPHVLHRHLGGAVVRSGACVARDVEDGVGGRISGGGWLGGWLGGFRGYT